MSFKMESYVTPEKMVMFQLMGAGHVVGMATFHLDVTREFMAALLILKDKLNADHLIDVPDDDIVPVPDEGSGEWN